MAENDILSFLRDSVSKIALPAIVYRNEKPIWSNCFAQEESFIPQSLFLSMAINPEYSIAIFTDKAYDLSIPTHSLDNFQR